MSHRIAPVIPVYNGADLLRRAIDSVLSHRYPVDELIVVDDGSTDATAQVARSYGSRLKYIYQETAGVAAARNHGMRAASSEWIAFLDHDDEWLSHKLNLQVQALESHPEAALCYSASWIHYLPSPQRYILCSFHRYLAGSTNAQSVSAIGRCPQESRGVEIGWVRYAAERSKLRGLGFLRSLLVDLSCGRYSRAACQLLRDAH